MGLELKKEKEVLTMNGIKQWYIATYPSDELGYELTEYGTFYDLHDGIVHGYDIYSFLGVSDSLVRERVFLELASIYDTSYAAIYETWVNNSK